MLNSFLPYRILHELILIYACWSIGFFFFRKNEFICKADVAVTWLIRIVGIAYFLQFPLILILGWLSGSEYESYAFIGHNFSLFLFEILFFLLVYLFSTQSLWFVYFRKARFWRLAFGLLILTANLINELLLLFSGLGKDIILSSWAVSLQSSPLHIESVVVFCLVIGLGYFITRKIN
jgi:hypothetical protein